MSSWVPQARAGGTGACRLTAHAANLDGGGRALALLADHGQLVGLDVVRDALGPSDAVGEAMGAQEGVERAIALVRVRASHHSAGEGGDCGTHL